MAKKQTTDELTDQPAVAEQATEATASAAAEAADSGDSPETATLVPCNLQVEVTDGMKELLLDACERYQVNPTVECQPRELLAWTYHPGSKNDRIPPSVTIVTGGGKKLRHYADPDYPMDPETEDLLAQTFGAFRTDPVTKVTTRIPLPADLALPAALVTGQSTRTDHIFRRGYLKEGGKAEGERRAARAKK